MHADCKLQVANLTLDDSEVYSLLNSVEPIGICNVLPDSIVPLVEKQEIIDVAGKGKKRAILLSAIKESTLSDKMDKFLTKLYTLQRHISEEVRKIYNALLQQHDQQQCPKCNTVSTAVGSDADTQSQGACSSAASIVHSTAAVNDVMGTTAEASGGFALKADSNISEAHMDYMKEKLCPLVCQVSYDGMSATGFVLGKVIETSDGKPHRFILSCYHCKFEEAFKNRLKCSAVFGYVRKPDFVQGTVTGFAVDIEPQVYAQDEELDYVLLRLAYSDKLETHLGNAESMSGMFTNKEPASNEPIILIGHPKGEEKKINIGAHVADRFELRSDPKVRKAKKNAKPETNLHALDNMKFLLYQCSVFHGASGSPCISLRDGKLYAMHCNGVYLGPETHEGVRSYVEYGSYLSEIFLDIQRQSKLTENQFQELFPFLETYMDTN